VVYGYLMTFLLPSNENTPLGRLVSVRDQRAVAAVQSRTLVRMAQIRADALVQTEKVHSLAFLGREAISNQALLDQHRQVLAHGNPFLADELRFFTEVVRLGQGEIIADTVSDWCQEGRRW
jgi:hypothetical protein